MDMVEIDRATYDEFLKWKNGGKAPKPSKAPDGGWRFYREGANPFSRDTLNTSAQSELVAYDPELALRLAESVGSPMASVLRDMQKKALLQKNGYNAW